MGGVEVGLGDAAKRAREASTSSTTLNGDLAPSRDDGEQTPQLYRCVCGAIIYIFSLARCAYHCLCLAVETADPSLETPCHL